MAIRAAEVELALSSLEKVASPGDEGLEPRVVPGIDGNAARVLCDECGERHQVVAFVRKRRRLLMPRAAQIDALLQIDGTSKLPVEGGIAGRDAFHAGARVVMTIGAGLTRRSSFAFPHRLAVEHPQHAGIGSIVVLHRLCIRRHEAEAGSAFGLRNVGGGERRGRDIGRDQQRRNGYRARKSHSTVMEAEAVSAKPLSPIHSKSNFPLSAATVKKVMNGFAAIAGNRSARKISTPL